MDNFNKKYSNRGKPIHHSLLINYSTQILNAMIYLHEKRFYCMHLHTGNVLIDEETNKIQLVDLENCIFDIPIRNEHLMSYAFDSFNEDLQYTRNDKNSSILTGIFGSKINIFEKLDVISLGRIIYEMATGKELNAPYPDDLEYHDMEDTVVEVLRVIFNRKGKSNRSFFITLPDISSSDLRSYKLFNNELLSKRSKSKTLHQQGSDVISIEFEDFSNLKEEMFNQEKFIKSQLKKLNNIKN